MKDLTKGNIWKHIMLFTLPMIGANLMMLSHQFINSIIVGTFIGKEALAAVSQSYPILFCVYTLMLGVGSGSMVVISQYFGAKQYNKVQLTADTIHIILLILGLSIGALGYFFSDTLFTLMGTPDDVISDAVAYMSIYLGGIVFCFGFYTLSSILRGIGDSITPMYLYISASIINIILDIVMIAVMGYGVEIAALCTVISQMTVYFVAVIYINYKKTVIRINFTTMKLNKTICFQCLKYGLPTGFQQFLIAVANIILMTLVSPYGTDTIAGYGAGIRIDSIATIPIMNFSTAIAIFTGQNIGANQFSRLKKGLLVTSIYAILFSLLSTCIILLFAPEIIGLFGKDPNVISNGSEYLKIISCFYSIEAIMLVLYGYMKGTGAVRSTVIITVISLWITEIPLAVMLSDKYGTEGIWWSVPISWAVGCTCMAIYYRSNKWRNKSIPIYRKIQQSI